jgi:hypothetical protein
LDVYFSFRGFFMFPLIGTATSKINQNAVRVLLRLEELETRTLLSGAPIAVPFNLSGLGGNTISLVTYTKPWASALTPAQVQQAYGFNSPAAIAAGSTMTVGNLTGAGQTIAIVDAYDDPNIIGDLATFDKQYGLPGTTAAGVNSFLKKINQSGGTSLPAADAGWATEISLDVEWAHAIAPGAKIVLVEANSASYADLFAAIQTAGSANVGAHAVSMSWGGPEFVGESSLDGYFTGHSGIVYVASSGDNVYTNYPSASPDVLSVGGSSLYLNKQGGYGTEKAWDYSGGGYSLIYQGRHRYTVGESEPLYQQHVQNSGTRETPDVAYDANPNTGFSVYDSLSFQGVAGWQQYGGTSAGAPQWAALVALVDQGRASLKTPAGSLDGPTQLLPALYNLSSNNFHAIKTDDSGTVTFNGYNDYTGLGTPVSSLLIPSLIGVSPSYHSSGTAPGSLPPGTTVHLVFHVSAAAPPANTPAVPVASTADLVQVFLAAPHLFPDAALANAPRIPLLQQPLPGNAPALLIGSNSTGVVDGFKQANLPVNQVPLGAGAESSDALPLEMDDYSAPTDGAVSSAVSRNSAGPIRVVETYRSFQLIDETFTEGTRLAEEPEAAQSAFAIGLPEEEATTTARSAAAFVFLALVNLPRENASPELQNRKRATGTFSL